MIDAAPESCDVWRLTRENLWEAAGSVLCQFQPPPVGEASTLLRLPASVAVDHRTRFVSRYGTFCPSRYPPVPDGQGQQVVLVTREGAPAPE